MVLCKKSFGFEFIKNTHLGKFVCFSFKLLICKAFT